MIDHLFRHQYGKLVSVLTRLFGLRHLETIEDAVQDTFINAIRTWQGKPPDNPEAWLIKSAKNRVLDLFRKLSADDNRLQRIDSGTQTIAISELFLDHEINDSILRMVFAACNPILNPKDQISFALKTISGFSRKEIAAALLLKEETIKKRLSRARHAIQHRNISFSIPMGRDLSERLHRVLEVIYLIFNEGFHSTREDILIREDLCGEAIRLAKLLLQNGNTSTPEVHALFALFCFQASRLKSKIGSDGEIMSLAYQDRALWDNELIALGHLQMEKATLTDTFGAYHYEAAIAAEHIKSPSYSETDWDQIWKWYQQMELLGISPINTLNMAVVHLQRNDASSARKLLDDVDIKALEQRMYLYHGTNAAYYHQIGKDEMAIESIDMAIKLVKNDAELQYLTKKRELYLG